MIELTGRISGISLDYTSGKPVLSLEINEKTDIERSYDELKEHAKLSVKLAKFRNKRSNDANRYMWALCGKLAEKLDRGQTEIYREHIRDIGVCKQAEISENAAETLMRGWEMNGVGWIAEKADYAKTDGFVIVNLYYGSSTYNTKQMSRLINRVVENCKEQGIQTETPDEIARMVSLWEAEK